MSSDRKKLQFKNEVLKAFVFLEKQYGFHCKEASDYIVRFENQNVCIGIIHDRLSYEIRLEFGSNIDKSKNYNLNEVFHLDTSGEAKDIFFQSSSPEGVKKCIHQLAEMVKYYSGILFDEFDKAFEYLKNIRDDRCNKYMLKMDLDIAREKAVRAWKSGDYEQYVKIFTPLKKHLSKSELGKIRYAENKISKD